VSVPGAVRRGLLAVSVLSRVAFAQSVTPVQQVTVSDSVAAQFLVVAESAAAAPKDRAIWQRRFDSAHDTLQAVLNRNFNSGRADQSLRTLIAVSRFWSGSSLVSEFDRALNLPGSSPAIRVRALNLAAVAAFRIKDRERTTRWAEESIDVARSLGDSSAMGIAYQRLVQLALREGDHAKLRALADTGSFLCEHARNEDCQAYFLNMRGESARVLKVYDSAAIYYDRAGSIYNRISPVPRLDMAHNVGFTLLALGRVSDARARFETGLKQAMAAGSKPYRAYMVAGLASAAAADGNSITAANLFGLSDKILEEIGIVADPADAVEYERYRSLARGRLGSEEFDKAVKIGRGMSFDAVLAGIK
jgi:tetratricopeptide (TPR) repeat protein